MWAAKPELYLTDFVLLWHTYLLNAGKKLFVTSKNVKRSFFCLLKRPEKCCFCSDEEKNRIQFLSKPELSYVMATGGVGHVRTGVIWGGDNAAGLVLLDKHPLGCSFKEANLDFDFNKPVVRDLLYLHVCSYRDCAISAVSHISWPPVCASNSIVSPVSRELEAKFASYAMPTLICLEALFSLL